jgi:hypothetical protein
MLTRHKHFRVQIALKLAGIFTFTTPSGGRHRQRLNIPPDAIPPRS